MSGVWEERCADGVKCGRTRCPKCSPTQIVPSHQRGSKKPGHGSSRMKAKGYAVYSSGLGPLDDPLAAPFMTPDMAIAQAKKRAKKERVYMVVSRDGMQWLMVKWDGDVEELK